MKIIVRRIFLDETLAGIAFEALTKQPAAPFKRSDKVWNHHITSKTRNVSVQYTSNHNLSFKSTPPAF